MGKKFKVNGCPEHRVGGSFHIERKTVTLPNGKSMEFDVKVCQPQRSVLQPVYSLCHARMSGCVHNIPRHTG